MSNWIEVKAILEYEPDDWAVLHEVFDRHGIPGTLQTDKPPTLSGYLVEGSGDTLGALTEELKQFGATDVETRIVPDEDWAESWKQFFKPRRIGKRFVVRPTWEAFELAPEDLEIVLDPGQAFGTGDHPTTRMCLELMERIDFADKRVADIGCGSGILSVGAKKLGAVSVSAVDVDPLSVEASQENAARNAVDFEVTEGTGFLSLDPASKFDIVISNIISAALIHLAPEVRKRLNQGGTWVVSGIIEANWCDVHKAAVTSGFDLVEVVREGDWVAATLRR